MHILLIVGVTLLTAGAPNQPQPTGLGALPPLNLTLVKGSFEEAISTIARMSGVMIELDQSVSDEVRKASLVDNGPIRLRGASFEQTIDVLTRLKGLSYSIVDGTSVRIYKKA